MNCLSARKLLFAFADGQLGVKDNCEVLDHLKMCPECSGVVRDHQAIREVLRNTLSDQSLSEVSRTRILANMNSIRDHLDDRRDGELFPYHGQTFPYRRFAFAAILVLGTTFVLWMALADTDGFLNRSATGDPLAVSVPRGTSAASVIANVHVACCAHGPAHHRDELPTDLNQLTAQLNAHYGQKIAALTPNLADRGYEFESANYCGVRDKPGSEGCHVIYLANKAAPRRLSIFSVPRWDCLDKCDARAKPGVDGLRHYQVDLDDGGSLSILAWHNDATTYICCARESFELLRPMVTEMRTALAHQDDAVQFASGVPSP